jgi:CDP-glycerol glycerophosphotransferase (TagB/SpsB family)
LVGKILPKKDIILFGSMRGYAIADNSKYKFINEYKKNYYFITKNKELIKTAIFENVFPVYAYSLKGIYLQLFAKQCYYSHVIFDFIAALICGSEIMGLGHGIALKKIGPEAAFINIPDSKIKRSKMYYKIMPYIYYMYCNKVLCPDEKYAEEYHKFYSISNPELIIEEQPRVKYVKKNGKTRTILYAPTYRKYRSINDLIEKIGLLDKGILELLDAIDYNLVIRPHPIDVEDMRQVSFNHRISIDTSIDIYATLTKYSFFVTDYSSLLCDAMVLHIPCFFLIDDLEKYDSENSLSKIFYSIDSVKRFSNMGLLLKEVYRSKYLDADL